MNGQAAKQTSAPSAMRSYEPRTAQTSWFKLSGCVDPSEQARGLAGYLPCKPQAACNSGPASQCRAETMNTASQIQTSGQERNTVEKLVVTLRGAADAISASIEVEEGRTQLRDPCDPCYSILAKSMRTRLDNLRVTISMLEARAAN